MKRLLLLLFCVSVFFASNVYASETCDIFNNSAPSEHGEIVLAIVDAKLKKWPQNEKMKKMVSTTERMRLFGDSIEKIAYLCKNNQDFKAGLVLGEDLTIYKKMLLELPQ